MKPQGTAGEHHLPEVQPLSREGQVLGALGDSRPAPCLLALRVALRAYGLCPVGESGTAPRHGGRPAQAQPDLGSRLVSAPSSVAPLRHVRSVSMFSAVKRRAGWRPRVVGGRSAEATSLTCPEQFLARSPALSQPNPSGEALF